MFFCEAILGKKEALGKIWLAAHWEKKLTKAEVFETDIAASCTSICEAKNEYALRLSGHLLIGIARIYMRQVTYLFTDCNDALVKIKLAFRPEMTAANNVASITLPEVNLPVPDDFDLDQLLQISFDSHIRTDDVTSTFASQSRASVAKITLPDDLVDEVEPEFEDELFNELDVSFESSIPDFRDASEESNVFEDVGLQHEDIEMEEIQGDLELGEEFGNIQDEGITYDEEPYVPPLPIFVPEVDAAELSSLPVNSVPDRSVPRTTSRKRHRMVKPTVDRKPLLLPNDERKKLREDTSSLLAETNYFSQPNKRRMMEEDRVRSLISQPTNASIAFYLGQRSRNQFMHAISLGEKAEYDSAFHGTEIQQLEESGFEGGEIEDFRDAEVIPEGDEMFPDQEYDQSAMGLDEDFGQTSGMAENLEEETSLMGGETEVPVESNWSSATATLHGMLDAKFTKTKSDNLSFKKLVAKVKEPKRKAGKLRSNFFLKKDCILPHFLTTFHHYSLCCIFPTSRLEEFGDN
tara:strand:+ start:2530 stop:4092 length:1563 start_codon:yes stop_codon:yes gene_type:complete